MNNVFNKMRNISKEKNIIDQLQNSSCILVINRI